MHANHPWILNILLDYDKQTEGTPQPWKNLYDPDIQFLFGKYGLPEYVWKGKSIFKNLEDAPEAIQNHVTTFFEQERDRLV